MIGLGELPATYPAEVSLVSNLNGWLLPPTALGQVLRAQRVHDVAAPGFRFKISEKVNWPLTWRALGGTIFDCQPLSDIGKNEVETSGWPAKKAL